MRRVNSRGVAAPNRKFPAYKLTVSAFEFRVVTRWKTARHLLTNAIARVPHFRCDRSRTSAQLITYQLGYHKNAKLATQRQTFAEISLIRHQHLYSTKNCNVCQPFSRRNQSDSILPFCRLASVEPEQVKIRRSLPTESGIDSNCPNFSRKSR